MYDHRMLLGDGRQGRLPRAVRGFMSPRVHHLMIILRAAAASRSALKLHLGHREPSDSPRRWEGG